MLTEATRCGETLTTDTGLQKQAGNTKFPACSVMLPQLDSNQ